MEKERTEKESEELLKKEVESIIKAIGGEESEGLMIKEALETLVSATADKDDYSLKSINQGMQVLCSLNSSLFKFKTSKPRREISIPNAFKCPLSGELMNDPVTLVSGVTYDRRAIQDHLDVSTNRTCPKTDIILTHKDLTPNHLLREMILQWLKEHGTELPTPNPAQMTEDEALNLRKHLYSLLQKISSSYICVQNEAAEKLRLITDQNHSISGLLGEIEDSIPLLLHPLLEGNHDTHSHLQENLITIVYNMSDKWKNKCLMSENSVAILILIKSLTCDNIQTRRNALGALLRLSILDVNKHVICEYDALKPLINLLEEESPFMIKDILSVIFNLCRVEENKALAVSEGLVRVIMKILKDNALLIDESLAILEMLSTKHEAIEEITKLGGVSLLAGFLKESSLSDSSKQNCLAILHNMFLQNRSLLKEFNLSDDDSDDKRTILLLTQMGDKANNIIYLLRESKAPK